MLNLCILTGRLTENPELKTTDGQISVTRFSIAVQRNYKDKDGEYPTDFINCVAWRGTAEFISKYFKKGSMITVDGSYETRKYTDKNNNNRTAHEIKVEHAYFGDSGKKSEGDAPPAADANSAADFTEDVDDDLPF